MKKIDSLNLIPFIDIMLVLLVIVLTTASFVAREQVSIDIPEVESGKTQPAESDAEQKVITITKDGELYFDGEKTTANAIRRELSGLPKRTQIVIAGDRVSHLETFIELTTMLQELSLREVFVVVESK